MALCKKISLAAVSESIRSVIYISLLKTICLFKKCKNPTSQSFTSRYILYEKEGPERNSYAYGLLRQERHADRWVTVAIIAPFSNNKPSLMQFAAHCTESQLNSIHLLDALHDFMDAEARTH